MGKLIDLYSGNGSDHKGRFIDEIWTRDHFWLEHTHDYYIQWLFPLKTPSPRYLFIPSLKMDDMQCFAKAQHLKEQQQKSLDCLLSFFACGGMDT